MVMNGTARGADNSADEPPTLSSDTPHNNNSDDDSYAREYEVNGWQRGFDVQIHGVGAVVLSNDDEDDSSWESDESAAEGVDSAPSGYRSLPSEPPPRVHLSSLAGDVPSQDEGSHNPTNPTGVLKDLPSSKEEVLPIEHRPLPIPLGSEKVEEIRRVMQGIKLPSPAWASQVPDEQLLDVFRRMINQ